MSRAEQGDLRTATSADRPGSAISELTSPAELAGEAGADGALRPSRLADFIGQHRVRAQMDLVLRAAVAAERVADHVLLSGPPGLGKTTLAMIVAAELGVPIRVTSGPAITHAGDLASVLTSLAAGEVLFIDEIHRLPRQAEEMLYLAMEDYRVDVIVGKGPGATAIPLQLAPFTLVGATTRAGLVAAPLRDRFGFTAQMDYYESEELREIVCRSAHLLGLPVATDGASEIAGRSRGTPRIANRLLRRVRDYAEIHGDGGIRIDTARSALEMYEVDDLGLDRLDNAVMRALVGMFGGGPVGLSTLAVAVGEEPETIETVVEPYLVRLGMLMRTPRGRIATPAAYRHLGVAPPAPAAAQGDVADDSRQLPLLGDASS